MADDVTVFGLGNCDTCRAARKWLDGRGIAYRFHDFAAEHGAETLINRRSRTWREIPEERRDISDPAAAAALVLANPKLVKRPVIALGDRSWVGFGDAVREAVEG
ncbi:MAG: arsenate reductase [Rhodospirillales bacterium]|nr:arsenate reductase [Rhodospirillales bacterium]